METPKSTQQTVTIDQELWSALADWLESEKAKKLGYHSKAQFCTEAVRELLEYHRQNKPLEQKILDEIGQINTKMDKKEWLLNQLAFYKKKHKTASTFQVWQEGFHPQLLFDDEVLAQKVDYIHFNPVKRGFVESPEYWRYSSARNYLKEDHSIIEIDSLLA